MPVLDRATHEVLVEVIDTAVEAVEAVESLEGLVREVELTAVSDEAPRVKELGRSRADAVWWLEPAAPFDAATKAAQQARAALDHTSPVAEPD